MDCTFCPTWTSWCPGLSHVDSLLCCRILVCVTCLHGLLEEIVELVINSGIGGITKDDQLKQMWEPLLLEFQYYRNLFIPFNQISHDFFYSICKLKEYVRSLRNVLFQLFLQFEGFTFFNKKA